MLYIAFAKENGAGLTLFAKSAEFRAVAGRIAINIIMNIFLSPRRS